jgi:hypothetical protein
VDMTGARWRKSSFSTGNGGGDDNCVEVAVVRSAMAVRDSKNAVGPVLVLPTSAFRALLAETRRG